MSGPADHECVTAPLCDGWPVRAYEVKADAARIARSGDDQ